jgi:arabinose-5-phosphate isomerase
MAPSTVRKFSPAIEVSPAIRTLRTQAAGLRDLERALDGEMRRPFDEASRVLGKVTGRVIVTGMGKSGHIGAKIAARLLRPERPLLRASGGSEPRRPRMIAQEDAIVALSWSGETAELRNIVFYSRRFRVPWSPSPRAPIPRWPAPPTWRWSFHASKRRARTASRRRPPRCCSWPGRCAGHRAPGKPRLHRRRFLQVPPRRSLGANLAHVRDVMHKGDRLPLAPIGMPMREALLLITRKASAAWASSTARGNSAGSSPTGIFAVTCRRDLRPAGGTRDDA